MILHLLLRPFLMMVVAFYNNWREHIITHFITIKSYCRNLINVITMELIYFDKN